MPSSFLESINGIWQASKDPVNNFSSLFLAQKSPHKTLVPVNYHESSFARGQFQTQMPSFSASAGSGRNGIHMGAEIHKELTILP